MAVLVDAADLAGPAAGLAAGRPACRPAGRSARASAARAARACVTPSPRAGPPLRSGFSTAARDQRRELHGQGDDEACEVHTAPPSKSRAGCVPALREDTECGDQWLTVPVHGVLLSGRRIFDAVSRAVQTQLLRGQRNARAAGAV